MGRCLTSCLPPRPAFAEILSTLTRLRQKLGGHTPPLGRYQLQPSLSAQRERAQIQMAMALGTHSGASGGSIQEQQKKVRFRILAVEPTGLGSGFWLM
jgi:hypothetical protein